MPTEPGDVLNYLDVSRRIFNAVASALQQQLASVRHVLAGAMSDANYGDATESGDGIAQLARHLATAKATLEASILVMRQSHKAELDRLQAAHAQTMALFQSTVDVRTQAETRAAAELALLRAEHAATQARLATALQDLDCTRTMLTARADKAEAQHQETDAALQRAVAYAYLELALASTCEWRAYMIAPR